MSNLIPKKTRVRTTSLASLFSNLAASNVGVAFLSAQITDLEERCAAIIGKLQACSDEQSRSRGSEPGGRFTVPPSAA